MKPILTFVRVANSAQKHPLTPIDDTSMSYRCIKMTWNDVMTSTDIDVHAPVFQLTSMTEAKIIFNIVYNDVCDVCITCHFCV